MRALIFAFCCSLMPVAAQAQSFEAVNRLTVIPINGSDFEVIEDNGAGPRGIWCAAADYADARLRTPVANRIYVKTARGPSVTGGGAKGVVFTTSPGNLNTATSYSVTVRQPGISLRVGHAIQFCKDYLIEPQDSILFRRVQP